MILSQIYLANTLHILDRQRMVWTSQQETLLSVEMQNLPRFRSLTRLLTLLLRESEKMSHCDNDMSGVRTIETKKNEPTICSGSTWLDGTGKHQTMRLQKLFISPLKYGINSSLVLSNPIKLQAESQQSLRICPFSSVETSGFCNLCSASIKLELPIEWSEISLFSLPIVWIRSFTQRTWMLLFWRNASWTR